jgi:hypothetical protein
LPGVTLATVMSPFFVLEQEESVRVLRKRHMP